MLTTQQKQKVKEMMKEFKMSEEEEVNSIALFEHLSDSYLEKYEKKIFSGKTINELLASTQGNRL